VDANLGRNENDSDVVSVSVSGMSHLYGCVQGELIARCEPACLESVKDILAVYGVVDIRCDDEDDVATATAERQWYHVSTSFQRTVGFMFCVGAIRHRGRHTHLAQQSALGTVEEGVRREDCCRCGLRDRDRCVRSSGEEALERVEGKGRPQDNFFFAGISHGRESTR